MPKAAKKAKKRARKKKQSDIFIYRLESGAYSTEPSPFIIHKDREAVQFRNLTSERVRLRFKNGPLDPASFTVSPSTPKAVAVNVSAKPGVYEYKVEFATPPPVSGLQQLSKTYAQGHSSPKMIVDT